MNILILGGTLFIGRALVEKLIKSGFYNITLLNRGTRSQKFDFPINIIKADRSDVDQMKEVLNGKNYNVVFDISGYTEEDIGTAVSAMQGGSEIGHYVFCSSIAVCRQSPSHWPITEVHEKCSSPDDDRYGFDKWQAEEYLWQMSRDKFMNVTIVRPTYVYGPYNYYRRETFVFDQISQGLPIYISGNGDNIVQFGYVYDLADAMIEMAGNQLAHGHAFNVSGNELVTVNQFISLIAEIMKKDTEIIRNSSNRERTAKFPAVHRFADISKIRDVLGIKPTTDIQEGLIRTFRWWKENRKEKKS